MIEETINYTIDKDKTHKRDGIKNISQQDKIKVV